MNLKQRFSLKCIFSKDTVSAVVLLTVISCIAPLISGCSSAGCSGSACCGDTSTAQHAGPAQCTPPSKSNAIIPAAPGSIEAQLMSKGKQWRQTEGPIVVGTYVEDILKNRLGQPQGRGFIGKVISVTGDAAMVDFGRGYKVGIFLSELRPISFDVRS